jgi:hypothetical protein
MAGAALQLRVLALERIPGISMLRNSKRGWPEPFESMAGNAVDRLGSERGSARMGIGVAGRAAGERWLLRSRGGEVDVALGAGNSGVTALQRVPGTIVIEFASRHPPESGGLVAIGTGCSQPTPVGILVAGGALLKRERAIHRDRLTGRVPCYRTFRI